MSCVATLAGVPITGAAAWAHIVGPRPLMRAFEIDNDGARELLQKLGQEVTLRMEVNGAVKEFRRLLIVGTQPGRDPHHVGILVADRRWLWTRHLIVRDFNARRRTGETRMVGEGQRDEGFRPAPDIAYAPWTLDAGTPFSPRRAIESVLAELEPGNYTIASVTRQVLVEDGFISHPGDMAMDMVLGYAPGYTVRPDDSGRFHVIDSRDGGEAQVIARAGPPKVGQGYPAKVDRSFVRPSEMHIHFERACDLRFDHLEGENPWTAERGDAGRGERKLENVMQQPNPRLTLANGTVAAQGTWLTVDDVLAAYSGREGETGGGYKGPLSHATIRYYYLSQWSLLQRTYGVTPQGQFNKEWSKLLDGLIKSWRLTFRIGRPWRDKLRRIEARRADLYDVENGLPSKSVAYMDYLARPSKAGLAKTSSQNPTLGRQVAGWATLLKDAEAAPAFVDVVDDQAGIIHVTFRRDPWGDTEEMAPGNVANLPTQAVNGDLKDASGAVFATWGYAQLLPTFRCAIVLSAIQAAPNGIGRLHRETVTPSQAAAALGENVGACNGPVWNIMVGAGVETARFGWDDAYATQIEEAFFSGKPEAQMPASLLVNKATVRARAVAEAARLYQTTLDRTQGTYSVEFNPDLEIAGAVQSIEWYIRPTGQGAVAGTTLVLPPEFDPIDPMAFVPASIQRIARRMVNP